MKKGEVKLLPLKEIVYQPAVRKLCFRPYPNHKHGCPNYGRKPYCPPKHLLLDECIDRSKPVYAVAFKFDIGSHAKKMRAKHPDWTERQVYNLYFWQTQARKILFSNAYKFLRQLKKKNKRYYIEYCPEAAGVNLTATMKNIGIRLQWPPRDYSYLIVLIGCRP